MGEPIGGGTDTANPLLTGKFSATGNSDAAILYARFNVAIWGTFVGTVSLERSFDGGTTWLPYTRPALSAPDSLTAPASLVCEEPEHQVAYRLTCSAYTSGTINYRISQASDWLYSGGVSR